MAPAFTFGDIERSIYIGQSLTAILYGIQLCLCCQSIHYLCKTSQSRKTKQFYITYSVVIVFLNAIMVACNSLFGLYMWIENRENPGGVLFFYATHYNWWVNTLGNIANLSVNILSDGLLLYRCCVIFMHSFASKWTLALPSSLFIAVVAFGITANTLNAITGMEESDVEYNHRFFQAWLALSVGFNIVVTAMISVRILRARSELRKFASLTDSNTYGGVVALLIESALPLTVSGLLILVLMAIHHPGLLASTTWGIIMGISPQLIILRVATGNAWSRETMARSLSAVNFESAIQNNPMYDINLVESMPSDASPASHSTISSTVSRGDEGMIIVSATEKEDAGIKEM